MESKYRNDSQRTRLDNLQKVVEKWFKDQGSITIEEFERALYALRNLENIEAVYCRCGDLALFECGLCPEHLIQNFQYAKELREFVARKAQDEKAPA